MRYILLFAFFSVMQLCARTLTVGTGGDGYNYDYLQQACHEAAPGDTILVCNTEGSDGEYIENLKGTANAWIYIFAAQTGNVEYSGNETAIHFVDPEYIYVKGLVFRGQTVNGVNADDGGSYDTPAKYVVFDSCTWKDMAATGNNDQLKLSGLDYFTIKNCTFTNASEGGSQIDMVGCHYGYIQDCRFSDGGSNAIQAKGGSSNLAVTRNRFDNCGDRAINIGGSTGEPYFRPPDADYESKQIIVIANIFTGSQAPIAFVGTVNSVVANNTIIEPGKWAIRILQENTGKVTCGNNIFANNLVVLNNSSVNPVINIGPNTAPETFVFSTNLWYNKDNPDWDDVNLPVVETGGIYKTDPQFVPDDGKYIIGKNSPATGKGMNISQYFAGAKPLDFYGTEYNVPPSVGAVEGNPPTTGIPEAESYTSRFRLVPNPVDCNSRLLSDGDLQIESIELYDVNGARVACTSEAISAHEIKLDNFIEFGALPAGVYYLLINNDGENRAIPFLFLRDY